MPSLYNRFVTCNRFYGRLEAVFLQEVERKELLRPRRLLLAAGRWGLKVGHRIQNDPVLVSKLVAYQAERLPSGLMRYGATGAGHAAVVTPIPPRCRAPR